MAQVGKEHRVCFEILSEIRRTDYAIEFMLKSEYGPKPMNCPKSKINVYRYIKDGRSIREVWMPQWLAEKAGLI